MLINSEGGVHVSCEFRLLLDRLADLLIFLDDCFFLRLGADLEDRIWRWVVSLLPSTLPCCF